MVALDADVIIIGAGPAGAAAAFHLASRDRSVLLLEQRPTGAGKPCGGGMAASVQRWFPFDLTPAVEQVIRRVRFTWCLQDPVLAELPGDAPFWIVQRSRFDAFLSDQARQAGAVLRQPCQAGPLERRRDHWVVQLTDGTTLRSRAVLLADGSGSSLASRYGLGPARPRYAATVSVEVEVEGAPLDPDTARFEFGLVHHGFCWAFPRRQGWSIGVGTFIGRQEADSDAVLSAMLPSLGLPASAGIRRAGQLRIWDGHHPLHGRGDQEGLLVAGDAASLCDPFLAEGLRPSLLSGCRAAEALDRWLAGDSQAPEDYSRRMRAEWGDSMAWGRRIARVFYRVPNVGYQLGIKRATAPQRIAQILSGEMGYGDIAQRVIRRLLFQAR